MKLDCALNEGIYYDAPNADFISLLCVFYSFVCPGERAARPPVYAANVP